ncbi:MAG: adenosylmethionine--8-amino-7-oxononanoate transaminase [Nocardioides sp.]
MSSHDSVQSRTTDAHRKALDFDRGHLWHPYASMPNPTPVQLVAGADGTRLQLADGRQVIDGMSSWWAAIHGYRHPALDAAVHEQAGRMSHVMFGGLTHEPAVAVAERLVELAPSGSDRLEHVFLADSGSVSVEVALKMAAQFQRGAGRPERTRMLALRGGYHGDTLGAMSVCDPVSGMHSMFTGLLPRQIFAPRPPPVGSPAESVADWISALEALVRAHQDQIAAIVAEPLLQGAGGMHAYPAACLAAMRRIADDYDLLLILDEIATGFGRTGTMFAAEAAGIAPDIMCVGKALTGGYLTLAATLCTPRVAAGISRTESGVLAHGPTYMANPLACAVAAASIDLVLATDALGQVARIRDGLAASLAPLRGEAGVRDVRVVGAVGVVQLDRPVDVTAATQAGLGAGVWLRPFRDLIYTMPPYICTDEEIATICRAIVAATGASVTNPHPGP